MGKKVCDVWENWAVWVRDMKYLTSSALSVSLSVVACEDGRSRAALSTQQADDAGARQIPSHTVLLTDGFVDAWREHVGGGRWLWQHQKAARNSCGAEV